MSSTNRGAKRAEKDAYPTPSWCTELIVDELIWGLDPQVYEPCAGDGAISRVLRERVCFENGCGHLEENDIADIDGFDFLEHPERIEYDFILTNPPFSLAQEFVERSLKIANCVIMLLPLGFYGSESRHEWWTQHEPTAQFILSKRPMFAKNKEGKWGTDSETYAWLVWDSTGRQKRGIYHLRPRGNTRSR